MSNIVYRRRRRSHWYGRTRRPTVIDRYFVKHHMHWRPPLIFAARCYLASSAALAIMRCLSVRLSVTFVRSVKTNKHIFEIFHRRVAKPFYFFHTERHGNIPTGIPLTGASNAGRVGRYRDSEPIYVPAASAIHLAATNHAEFITLVADKRPNLLMVGNNDEVCDNKPQRYVDDNVTQW